MNRDSPSPPSAAEPAPRLRDRLREETARAILAAAEDVFAEEGLSAARMERIAGRAGVAVGTLYNHFEDRQALISALACSRRDAFFTRLDAALAVSKAKPVSEQLRAFLGAVAEHAKAHGRYLSMLVQSGEGPAHASPVKSLIADLVARADAIVARGVASGELRADAGEVMGLALVGSIRAANVRVLEGGATWGPLIEPLVELFLRGARR